MNKILLILLTLLLLMLILNHTKDESKSKRTQAYEDQRKKLEEVFGGKAKYGDGRYVDPSTLTPLAPSVDDRTDRPTTAPPPGTPLWCPPPQKIGSSPLDTDTVDTQCINY